MAFPWMRVLVVWPARIVDGWFTAYRILLLITTIVTVSMVVVVLLLAALGVRWGW